MNSIGCIVAALVGCGVGLLVLDHYPAGLESAPGLMLLCLATVLAVCLWPAWRHKRARWTYLYAIFAIAACGRTLLAHQPPTPNDLAYYNRPAHAPDITLVGSISAEPVVQDRYQRLRVSAETLRLRVGDNPTPVKGDLLVLLPRFPAYSVGERLLLVGVLTAPPKLSTFDYPAYLARQGVYSYMGFPRAKSLGTGEIAWTARLVSDARRAVREAIQRSVPEPQASLTIGVVTGDRSSMPPNVQQDFLASGTVHVLAISGQNMALVVGFVWLLYSMGTGSRRLSLWATLVTLLLLGPYTLFTGATPSVVRAAAMGVVLLLGPVLGRRYDPVAAIAVTAFCLAALNPYVLADAGFQLSFAAMLGITLLSPGLYRAINVRFVPGWLAAALAAGVGAQLASLPLVVLLVGRVSLVSLPASLMIEPVLLPLMIAGILTGVVGAIAPPLAVVFSPLAWFFAGWMLLWVGWWASLPWASIQLDVVNPIWAFAYYAAVAYFLWMMAYSGRQRIRGQGSGIVDQSANPNPIPDP